MFAELKKEAAERPFLFGMVNKLSEEIGKYYERRGHKIVFRNGMSLNKLALEMWERLDFKEIDPSVLSRVIAGERILTPAQIKTLAEILRLNEAEKEGLQRSMLFSVAQRMDLKEEMDFCDCRHPLDLALNNLEKIEKLELSDNLLIASEWSSVLIEYLNHLFEEGKIKNGGRVELMETMLKLIYTKIRIMLPILPTNKLETDLFPLIIRMQKYATELKNDEYHSLIDTVRAHYYYSGGNDFNRSVYYGKRSLDKKTPYEKDKLCLVRILALDYAFLKDLPSYMKTEKIAKEMIKSGDYPLTEMCECLEGLGRAKAILNLKDYTNEIEDSWSLYRRLESQGERIAFRKVQLARTEIEAYSGKKIVSMRCLEESGIGAIKVARDHGFKRHALKIWGMLNLIL